MATDEQLAKWDMVTAAVTPNTSQTWAMMVNAERWPTIAEQQRVIAAVIHRLGGKNVEFLRFSPSRIQPPKMRENRQSLAVNFLPVTRGKPMWWLVKWNWFGTMNAVPWPAVQHGILTTDIDPLAADVLLDATGGLQEPVSPPVSIFTTIERTSRNFETGTKNIGLGLGALGLIAAGIYISSQLKSKG